ncbi:MAG: hypothetical protein CO150_00370 [Nitrospirae bacterium CG_4_9_14_3_um_filter_53_35]|nr:MAG: hypothetical protein AUK29_05540 [Nitrospirae bacterium CG2_30_53_67]PIS35902.1 MAG: hypothetical protein COT35_13985 [Nitrospirae bacterium CG08_land_8_20_14_0_20_52_24]PIV82417.1 MAG: hypothetical protein COW52_13710 [Nitrospirae bacterium CG17_big_fil_post_rev_8_21_14_2_50_50_9]PIW85617.1 MAG: hypothetical protein COZ95_03575 [Nitrospirae bacterium CG_4_8_14_3_um_filter_50_41]PIX85423.1 MAG: hypothetical protein COZ32_08600 [Nitrospirae bacterium CG_4_10_14_3_um_filter_53_41]PJA7754
MTESSFSVTKDPMIERPKTFPVFFRGASGVRGVGGGHCPDQAGMMKRDTTEHTENTEKSSALLKAKPFHRRAHRERRGKAF